MGLTTYLTEGVPMTTPQTGVASKPPREEGSDEMGLDVDGVADCSLPRNY
jgi:hypothetical protein